MATEDAFPQDFGAELRRQVFLANYQSREQRVLRAVAALILVTKHSIRGSLLFLPLYLILAVVIMQPEASAYLPYFALLLPGLGWWFVVQLKGAHKDFSHQVEGKLLKRSDLKALLHSVDD